VGTYKIDHHIYDAVKVEDLYPWQPNPEDPSEYGGALQVSFMREGRRVRWAEFSIRFTGGGGSPAVFKVK
jgi:hypothetical protein